MSAPRLARIETAMQRYIDKDLTPGVITAIVRKGKLGTFQHKATWTEQAKPMREDTIFRIASMTKPITSRLS